MDHARRKFVTTALKGSVLSLAFTVGGNVLMLTPEQARAQSIPFQKLTEPQARVLEILGQTIVPGSKEAGLTHFLDHELSVDPNEALLIAKYFQAPLPYSAFYGGGIATAQKLARKSFHSSIEQLDASQLTELVKGMSNPTLVVDGYPAFLFYLCLRSDAVDVVYGTPAGFQKLNIPYMQHILPPEGWNG
jgi:hypothetical protein